ncbi:MAG: nuclear transport factor 2 family protein [Gammaproteobacteria bacterium]
MTSNSSLQHARDRLAILYTLHEYCRLGDCWDAQSQADWPATVAPDLVIRYGALGEYRGREAFFRMCDDYHKRWKAMQHICHSPRVELDGDEATVITPHIAVHVPLDGGPVVQAGTTWLHRMRRIDGAWVIAEAAVEFVWSDHPEIIPGKAWSETRARNAGAE